MATRLWPIGANTFQLAFITHQADLQDHDCHALNMPRHLHRGPDRDIGLTLRMKFAAPIAVLLLLLPVTVARGEGSSPRQCAADCRAGHNQCRMATKNSPSCDAKLQNCLQSCLRR